MAHPKMKKNLWFNGIDRAGLALALAVLVFFLAVWLLLVMAAGPAPTGRLTAHCLTWTLQAETRLVLPLWLAARAVYLAGAAFRAWQDHRLGTPAREAREASVEIGIGRLA